MPTAAHLDQDNFRNLYRHANSEYPYHLYVGGINCSSCVHRLERLPEFNKDVLEARVQFANSRLQIKVGEHFSLAGLQSLLKDWGYDPRYLVPEELNNDHFVDENRLNLSRIAVAGACTGNIMLFVIPVYGGLEGSLRTAFNWMSFALFLPVLFYSARGFYQGAWASLRNRTVNLDLSITVALWSGFLMSTVNLIRGEDRIYFDSTASFLFLILSARYLLKRVQQIYLRPLKVVDFSAAREVRKKEGSDYKFIPLSEVGAGDVLTFAQNETLPMDGELLSDRATLNMAAISGESLPRTFSKKMELLAGSTVLDKEIDIRVNTKPDSSRLSKILRELEDNSAKKNAVMQLTDRLARHLVIAVFAIAAAFFVIYSFIDMQEAFDRSLALLVLACPCALAFGAPLTYALAMKKALSKGILIKNSASLEKILTLKNIFFDKTGTLTEGRLYLTHSEPQVLCSSVKSIILGLESGSLHPVAFALRELWADVPLCQITERSETLGHGVQGKVGGQLYSLHTLSESVHDKHLGVVLLRGTEVLCRLYFEDPLRTDASQMVDDLQSRNLNCHLLSGDRRERVLAVAQSCGLNEKNCHAELFPEDKKKILVSHPGTCMIGDGANDVLSLNAADVGIAMSGGVPLSLGAADIYLLRGGLAPIRELFVLAEKSQKVLYRNLSLSLVYNFIGGTLALAGFIDPLAAAILMPLSSALIVVSTLWGLK